MRLSDFEAPLTLREELELLQYKQEDEMIAEREGLTLEELYERRMQDRERVCLAQLARNIR